MTIDDLIKALGAWRDATGGVPSKVFISDPEWGDAFRSTACWGGKDRSRGNHIVVATYVSGEMRDTQIWPKSQDVEKTIGPDLRQKLAREEELNYIEDLKEEIRMLRKNNDNLWDRLKEFREKL